MNYATMGIRPVKRRQGMTAATISNLELASMVMAVNDPLVVAQAIDQNVTDVIGFAWIVRLFSTPWTQVGPRGVLSSNDLQRW